MVCPFDTSHGLGDKHESCMEPRLRPKIDNGEDDLSAHFVSLTAEVKNMGLLAWNTGQDKKKKKKKMIIEIHFQWTPFSHADDMWDNWGFGMSCLFLLRSHPRKIC